MILAKWGRKKKRKIQVKFWLERKFCLYLKHTKYVNFKLWTVIFSSVLFNKLYCQIFLYTNQNYNNKILKYSYCDKYRSVSSFGFNSLLTHSSHSFTYFIYHFSFSSLNELWPNSRQIWFNLHISLKPVTLNLLSRLFLAPCNKITSVARFLCQVVKCQTTLVICDSSYLNWSKYNLYSFYLKINLIAILFKSVVPTTD